MEIDENQSADHYLLSSKHAEMKHITRLVSLTLTNVCI